MLILTKDKQLVGKLPFDKLKQFLYLLIKNKNMNVFKVVLLFLISLSLLSCNKDNDFCKCNMANLNLYQTYWEGTILLKESGQERSFQIKVFFDSINHGEYSITNFSPDIPYSKKSIFTYKIDGKMLLIEDGYNNILLGYWFVTNVNEEGDGLVLQHNIIDEVSNSVLFLTKKY